MQNIIYIAPYKIIQRALWSKYVINPKAKYPGAKRLVFTIFLNLARVLHFLISLIWRCDSVPENSAAVHHGTAYDGKVSTFSRTARPSSEPGRCWHTSLIYIYINFVTWYYPAVASPLAVRPTSGILSLATMSICCLQIELLSVSLQDNGRLLACEIGDTTLVLGNLSPEPQPTLMIYLPKIV